MNTNSELRNTLPATNEAPIVTTIGETDSAQSSVECSDEATPLPLGFWTRAVMFAGMIVLGLTPWAHAQLSAPNQPAFCPPLTSIANPTLFNLFWGTTPIRFPYQ